MKILMMEVDKVTVEETSGTVYELEVSSPMDILNTHIYIKEGQESYIECPRDFPVLFKFIDSDDWMDPLCFMYHFYKLKGNDMKEYSWYSNSEEVGYDTAQIQRISKEELEDAATEVYMLYEALFTRNDDYYYSEKFRNLIPTYGFRHKY